MKARIDLFSSENVTLSAQVLCRILHNAYFKQKSAFYLTVYMDRRGVAEKIGWFWKAIFLFYFEHNPAYCWIGKLSDKSVTPWPCGLCNRYNGSYQLSYSGFNPQTRASFTSLFSIFFNNNLIQKHCRFQGDLNSNRRGRRRAHWSFNHHHGPPSSAKLFVI